MKRIAIGEIIIDLSGERIDLDAGSNQIEVSNFIPFGQINVFVGMVNTSGLGMEESDHDPLSGVATMARSDGEESVGTSEIDLPNTLLKDDPAWDPRRAIEKNEESVVELLEDRYGYEVEETDSCGGDYRRIGTNPA